MGGRSVGAVLLHRRSAQKILQSVKDSMGREVDVGLNVGPGAQQQNSRAFYTPPTFAVPSTQPLAPQGPYFSPDVTVSLPF